MTLGDKLIKYRKESKMTQDGVADVLKVTRQTISNWELNQTAPDLEQAKGLSKLYKISLDELIDNNIKEALTEKISNTEKLAGLIYKILKWFIVFFIGSIVLTIISFTLFSVVRENTSVNEGITFTELNCNLNDERYTIGIKSRNNKITELGGDAKLINILDLEKLSYEDQVVDKVTAYIENNGGTCN